MISEVRTAGADGSLDIHQEGAGFYLAPARPMKGGAYYPGAFPCRVRVDNGAPLDVPGPAVHWPGHFRRLRLLDAPPNSHWLVVVLREGEAFTRIAPTLATFNVLEGLGVARDHVDGWTMPAVAPNEGDGTKGFEVQANWRAVQVVIDWGARTPAVVHAYWWDGTRWNLSEIIPADESPAAYGRTTWFRQVMYPSGRIAFQDPTFSGTPVYYSVHVTAEVG